MINDNNVEYAAAAGTASTYTVTTAFIADKNIATAAVNGAISSTTAVTVDGNNGTIVWEMSLQALGSAVLCE